MIASRSYLELVDWLLAFSCSTINPETGEPWLGSSTYGFTEVSGPDQLEKGDLILLKSCHSKDFRLSWYHGSARLPGGGPKYDLESASTSARMWWENVSVNRFNRESLSHHPEWRYTEHHWRLWDNLRLALKALMRYDVVPFMPLLTHTGKPILRIRMRDDIHGEVYHLPITTHAFMTPEDVALFLTPWLFEVSKEQADRLAFRELFKEVSASLTLSRITDPIFESVSFERNGHVRVSLHFSWGSSTPYHAEFANWNKLKAESLTSALCQFVQSARAKHAPA